MVVGFWVSADVDDFAFKNVDDLGDVRIVESGAGFFGADARPRWCLRRCGAGIVRGPFGGIVGGEFATEPGQVGGNGLEGALDGLAALGPLQ